MKACMVTRTRNGQGWEETQVLQYKEGGGHNETQAKTIRTTLLKLNRKYKLGITQGNNALTVRVSTRVAWFSLIWTDCWVVAEGHAPPSAIFYLSMHETFVHLGVWKTIDWSKLSNNDHTPSMISVSKHLLQSDSLTGDATLWQHDRHSRSFVLRGEEWCIVHLTAHVFVSTDA